MLYLLSFSVSILVLVDLAFELYCRRTQWVIKMSFNPCFSGSCFRIAQSCHSWSFESTCFNPCFSGSCFRMTVIIHGCSIQDSGFNPCFSGSCFRIKKWDSWGMPDMSGFNPCFSGSCFRIMSLYHWLIRSQVSILVLVDLAFEWSPLSITTYWKLLFQSLF